MYGFYHYTVGGAEVLDDVFQFEDLDGMIQTLEDKLGTKFPVSLTDIKTKGGYRKKRPYQELINAEN